MYGQGHHYCQRIWYDSADINFKIGLYDEAEVICRQQLGAERSPKNRMASCFMKLLGDIHEVKLNYQEAAVWFNHAHKATEEYYGATHSLPQFASMRAAGMQAKMEYAQNSSNSTSETVHKGLGLEELVEGLLKHLEQHIAQFGLEDEEGCIRQEEPWNPKISAAGDPTDHFALESTDVRPVKAFEPTEESDALREGQGSPTASTPIEPVAPEGSYEIFPEGKMVLEAFPTVTPEASAYLPTLSTTAGRADAQPYIDILPTLDDELDLGNLENVGQVDDGFDSAAMALDMDLGLDRVFTEDLDWSEFVDLRPFDEQNWGLGHENSGIEEQAVMSVQDFGEGVLDDLK